MRRRLIEIGTISCVAALLALAGAGAGGQMAGVRAKAGKPAWRIAVQTYTFNRFTLFEAIDKAKALGLECIEAYPGQRLSLEKRDVAFSHDAPVDILAHVKNKLDHAGIRLVNYGVVGLGRNEEANRKVFDFAKLMGIETIVSEPEPGSFDLLDKLTDEYGINVAIHNHPRPSRYWNPDTVLEALKGHGKRIGACADTGHWMRSEVNPVEALRKLEGRIVSSHLKDLNKYGGGAHDVPWGTGEGDIGAILSELDRQGFSGVFSIEYEHNWENSMPEIAKCIAHFRKVSASLGRQ